MPLYDFDLTKDRKSDITHHDKTEYDEKTATFVTDYIHLVDEMGNLVLRATEKIKDPKDSKKINEEFNDLRCKQGAPIAQEMRENTGI